MNKEDFNDVNSGHSPDFLVWLLTDCELKTVNTAQIGDYFTQRVQHMTKVYSEEDNSVEFENRLVESLAIWQRIKPINMRRPRYTEHLRLSILVNGRWLYPTREQLKNWNSLPIENRRMDVFMALLPDY